MAEGGNQSSIQDGSDADITFACTPCSEEGTREEAIKYCPECDEYLCTTCTKCHLRMKISRDHKLVDREEGKHKSKVTTTTSKIKCLQHPDRDIEMYCGTHDMVYCSMCIATEHRPCADVTKLADAAVSNFQQSESEHQQEECESIKELLNDAENKKQENIVSIEEKRNEIQRRIQEIEDGMIKHIKSLSKQAKSNLDETYSKIKDEIDTKIAVLASSRSEVEKVQGQMHSTNEVDQEQNFVEVKLFQHILNDAKRVYEKIEADGQVSIDFSEDTDISQRFFEVRSFGKIQEARIKIYKEIKYQEEVTVKLQGDLQVCNTVDACQLESGIFVLADFNNKKIKFFDNKLKVIGNFELENEPIGVCRTGHNEVAVKLQNDTLEFLALDSNKHISEIRSFSVPFSGGYWGVAYTSGKFWVSTGNKVDVYDTSGTLEKSVKGKEIFNSYLRQMTVYKNLVFVADSSNGIVCLRNDGTKKAEFRDSSLTETVGVCISRDGTVYAIDKQSKKIVAFSQDGKYLGEMSPEVPSGKVPESLCYDDKNNCILIGYERSDTITALYLR